LDELVLAGSRVGAVQESAWFMGCAQDIIYDLIHVGFLYPSLPTDLCQNQSIILNAEEETRKT